LLENNVPFVSFGRTNNDWEFPCVDTDGHAGMRLAVEYLANIGHQRIAFMGWPPDSLSGNDRLQGYLDGMQAMGLPLDDSLIHQSEYPNGTVDGILKQWRILPMTKRPTAVIAIADFLAIALVRAAERHNFRVGETLSVVGFDGAPIGQFIDPPLTTLYQPMDVISQVLLDLFQDTQKGQKSEKVSRLIVPELIIRESSGPPQIE